MFIIIGLGNPGTEYEGTRHNIGYAVVDSLLEYLNKHTEVQIITLKKDKQVHADCTDANIDNKQIILAKSSTYMNDTGLAAAALVKINNPDIGSELVIIHDDITLELGQIKISKGKSSGNHKGVQSVIDHLHSQDFIRMRLGIGRGDGVLNDVVMSRFKPNEMKLVNSMVSEAADACISLVKNGLTSAMNKHN